MIFLTLTLGQSLARIKTTIVTNHRSWQPHATWCWMASAKAMRPAWDASQSQGIGARLGKLHTCTIWIKSLSVCIYIYIGMRACALVCVYIYTYIHDAGLCPPTPSPPPPMVSPFKTRVWGGACGLLGWPRPAVTWCLRSGLGC